MSKYSIFDGRPESQSWKAKPKRSSSAHGVVPRAGERFGGVVVSSRYPPPPFPSRLFDPATARDWQLNSPQAPSISKNPIYRKIRYIEIFDTAVDSTS